MNNEEKTAYIELLKSKINLDDSHEKEKSFKCRTSVSESHITRYEDTIKQMYMERVNLNKDVEDLKKELELVKEERDEAIMMNTNVEEELGKLMENFNEMNQECEKMAVEREEMENYIAFLEQNNKEIKENTLNDDSNNANYEKLQKKQEEVNFLKNELSNQKELSEQISKQRISIINHNESLNKKIEELTLENNTLSKKALEIDGLKRSYESQISQIKKQNENLNEIINTLNNEINSKENNKMNSDNQLRDQFKEKERSISELNVEKSELNQQISNLKSIIENLKNSLEDEREKHVKEISSHYDSISSLRKEARNLKDQLNESAFMNEKISSELDQAYEEIKHLKKSLDYYDKKNADFQKLDNEYRDLVEKYSALEEKYKEDIYFYEKRIEEYDEKLNKIQKEKKESFFKSTNNSNHSDSYSKLNDILSYLKFNCPPDFASFKSDYRVKNYSFIVEELHHYVKGIVSLYIEKNKENKKITKDNEEIKYLLNDQEERLFTLKREINEKDGLITNLKRERREEDASYIKSVTQEKEYMKRCYENEKAEKEEIYQKFESITSEFNNLKHFSEKIQIECERLKEELEKEDSKAKYQIAEEEKLRVSKHLEIICNLIRRNFPVSFTKHFDEYYFLSNQILELESQKENLIANYENDPNNSSKENLMRVHTDLEILYSKKIVVESNFNEAINNFNKVVDMKIRNRGKSFNTYDYRSEVPKGVDEIFIEKKEFELSGSKSTKSNFRLPLATTRENNLGALKEQLYKKYLNFDNNDFPYSFEKSKGR